MTADLRSNQWLGRIIANKTLSRHRRSPMSRAWAIKLGSGGRCVPFCEARSIVGVGWRSVDPAVLAKATRLELTRHVAQTCAWYRTPKEVGGAVGQLYRFSRECTVGDFVLYYVPSKKHVVVACV